MGGVPKKAAQIVTAPVTFAANQAARVVADPFVDAITPDMPDAPPAPPPPPQETDQPSEDERRRRRARARTGRRGTIATGPLGVQGEAPVQRPSLLGS